MGISRTTCTPRNLCGILLLFVGICTRVGMFVKFELNQVKIDALNSSWMLCVIYDMLNYSENHDIVCAKNTPNGIDGNQYWQIPEVSAIKFLDVQDLLYCAHCYKIPVLRKNSFSCEVICLGSVKTRGKPLGVNNFPQDKAQIVLPSTNPVRGCEQELGILVYFCN